ncbi:S4 domain-containing protein, partial [Bacillus licheniformis]
LVHGREAFEQAVNISKALFSGDIKQLTAEEVKVGFKGVPSLEVEKADELPLVEILVQSKLSPSKRQAREDITNGAVYVNGERRTDVADVLTADDRIEGQFTVIRRGKKKYFLLTYK